MQSSAKSNQFPSLDGKIPEFLGHICNAKSLSTPVRASDEHHYHVCFVPNRCCWSLPQKDAFPMIPFADFCVVERWQEMAIVWLRTPNFPFSVVRLTRWLGGKNSSVLWYQIENCRIPVEEDIKVGCQKVNRIGCTDSFHGNNRHLT